MLFSQTQLKFMYLAMNSLRLKTNLLLKNILLDKKRIAASYTLFLTIKQITMKNELTISNLIIKRFNQLAKPANLKERNEKEDLAALTYCEIEFLGSEIIASVCFNDNDLWFSYEVEFLDVVNHLFDVRNGEALIEYDIEGNHTQWIDVYDVEIDNHDVLTYLISNNMLNDYYQVTNEMGEVLDVDA